VNIGVNTSFLKKVTRLLKNFFEKVFKYLLGYFYACNCIKKGIK